MSWKKIDSPDVLRGLLGHERIGTRVICLDEFKQTYSLVLMRTDPAAVVVQDATAGGPPVGAYVWTGAGGSIISSRDVRVVQLGDALEAFYRGDDPPGFTSPVQVCPCCGESVHDASAGSSSGTEVELGEGVRGSVDLVTSDQVLDLVERHCTKRQVRTLTRLVLKKGYRVSQLLNERRRGGAAVERLTPILRDRAGTEWMLNEHGHLTGFEQGGTTT
jgi:hypothetical protein